MLNLKNIIPILAHLIWPEHCPVCGRVALSHCTECLESSANPLPLFCMDCGGLYGVDCCHGSIPCGAASLHDGAARDFLLKLKYHNARSLGLPMGRLMGRLFPGCKADFAVPIPLHKGSSREYNQSEMLARGAAEMWNMEVRCDMLSWGMEIGTQIGRSARSRNRIPSNAMSASEGVAGKSIILIDDVYTTGATLRAARNAVETAGGIVTAAHVWSKRASSLENAAAWKNIGV